MLAEKITLEAVDRAEALRYLGMGGKMPPDQALPALMDKCERELLRVIDVKYVYKVFIYREGVIENCAYQPEGEAIRRHLTGCDRVILLCATLSGGVDLLLRRKRLTGMAEAMVIDAMASAAMETVMDRIEEVLFSFPEFSGTAHTWRFSPGYADLPLSGQKAFLESVNAYRRIGVGCGDSFLMTPMKSVTCLIGLGESLPASSRKTCALCTLNGRCRYRQKPNGGTVPDSGQTERRDGSGFRPDRTEGRFRIPAKPNGGTVPDSGQTERRDGSGFRPNRTEEPSLIPAKPNGRCVPDSGQKGGV